MTECGLPGNPRPPFFNDTYSTSTGQQRPLQITDFVVLGIAVAISCFIGIFNSWNDKDELGLEGFLQADRQMSPILVGFSMTASFLSSIGLIGAPGLVYTFSWMYFMNPVGVFLLCVVTAHVYLPVLYRLDVITAYEYVELRFSKTLRTIVSVLFAFQTLGYMSATITGPSTAVGEVTGLPPWQSVLISVGICIVYTASGGMRGVYWTDTFQVFLMMSSLGVTLVVSMIEVGTWDEVKAANIRGGRYDVSNFDPAWSNGFTWWTSTYGFLITFLARFGIYQVQLQRALSCNTLRQAQTAVWAFFPIITVLFTLGCFVGAYLSAYYENCDPYRTKVVFSPFQLLPLYANDILFKYPGLCGIYYAGLAAAGMSTFSNHCYSLTGALYQDCVQNYVTYYIGDRSTRRIMKAMNWSLVIISSAVALGMTYWKTFNALVYMVYTHTGGAILGVFTLGMFFPFANTAGAYCGLFASLAIVYSADYISRNSKMPKSTVKLCLNNCPVERYKHLMKNATKIISNITTAAPPPRKVKPYDWYITFTYFAVLSCGSCLVIGIIVSLLTGPRNPKLMSPRLMIILSNIVPFSYLPYKFRKALRFGVPVKEPYLMSFAAWPPSSGNPSAATSMRSSAAGMHQKSETAHHPALHNISDTDFPSEQRID